MLRIFKTVLVLLRVKTSRHVGSSPQPHLSVWSTSHPHLWKYSLPPLLCSHHSITLASLLLLIKLSYLRAFALVLFSLEQSVSQVLMIFSLLPLGLFLLHFLSKSSQWQPPIKCQLSIAITSSCYASSSLCLIFFILLTITCHTLCCVNCLSF